MLQAWTGRDRTKRTGGTGSRDRKWFRFKPVRQEIGSVGDWPRIHTDFLKRCFQDTPSPTQPSQQNLQTSEEFKSKPHMWNAALILGCNSQSALNPLLATGDLGRTRGVPGLASEHVQVLKRSMLPQSSAPDRRAWDLMLQPLPVFMHRFGRPASNPDLFCLFSCAD